MTNNTKLFTSIHEQIGFLHSKGIAIDDHSIARNCLRHVGFLRLIPYIPPFSKISRKEAHAESVTNIEFVKGINFQQIIDLYEFDRHLRLLVLEGIELIENDLRVSFITELDKEMDRPIWQIVEDFNFKKLVSFYKELSTDDQDRIADKYDVQNDTLKSWLKGLVNLKNIVEKYEPLWNITFSEPLSFPDTIYYFAPILKKQEAGAKIAGALYMMNYIIRGVLPNSRWGDKVVKLLNTFRYIGLSDLSRIGFDKSYSVNF